jgi:hypothetical protein
MVSAFDGVPNQISYCGHREIPFYHSGKVTLQYAHWGKKRADRARKNGAIQPPPAPTGIFVDLVRFFTQIQCQYTIGGGKSKRGICAGGRFSLDRRGKGHRGCLAKKLSKVEQGLGGKRLRPVSCTHMGSAQRKIRWVLTQNICPDICLLQKTMV